MAAIGISVVFLTACGGGGGGQRDGGDPNARGITTDTPYSVSVNRGTIGSTPVTISDGAITIGHRTITEEEFEGGVEYVAEGHIRSRIFDAPGAASGPALEIHALRGHESSPFTLGAWAEGNVSPNPGFRISEIFGAFLLPNVDRTPVSNLPVTGSATWRGDYVGYVDREGVGVSQVAGNAAIVANFFSPSTYGTNGAITVELLPPDPARSVFATPPGFLGYHDRVLMSGPIDGNVFESDVTATRTVAGQTLPRGDSISVINPLGTQRTLYSTGSANSGGMQGAFFGSQGGGSGGTYQFTIGTTTAAGSFGGLLE